MNRRSYCVYNQTRECFLSLGVLAADTSFARLKGLIGRMRLRMDDGLWVVPSCGVHTIGVLFPLDLIYLSDDYKVIHVIEHFPRFSVSPIRTQATSVLQLPTHTIYSSQTQAGDQLVICAAEEMPTRFKRADPAALAASLPGDPVESPELALWESNCVLTRSPSKDRGDGNNIHDEREIHGDIPFTSSRM